MDQRRIESDLMLELVIIFLRFIRALKVKTRVEQEEKCTAKWLIVIAIKLSKNGNRENTKFLLKNPRLCGLYFISYCIAWSREMRNRKQLIKEMVWKIDKDRVSAALSITHSLSFYCLCTLFLCCCQRIRQKKARSRNSTDSTRLIRTSFQFKFKFRSYISSSLFTLHVFRRMCAVHGVAGDNNKKRFAEEKNEECLRER